MDGILLQENNKVSAEEEAHKNIESELDENYLYQIDNMSLNDKKEKTEWCNRAFEFKLENTYEIQSQNGMTCIHGNRVNKWSEFNLIHDILNPPKRTKHLTSHYSTILQVCMNIRKGKARFKNFRILLDSGSSSTL